MMRSDLHLPAIHVRGTAMVAESVEVLCQRARTAMEQRSPEKARQLYLQALGIKPDSPDVHYGLATVCFQLKDLPSAAYHFKEVTRLDPLRAGAYINLGAVLNMLQQLDEAVAALRRGIQLDPQRVEGYYNLGLVYRRKGQLDLSIQAYREALRLNPRMADAYLNLGNLFIEKQQYRQAISQYEEALKIRPEWDKAIEGREHAQEMLTGGAPVIAAPTPTGPQMISNELEDAIKELSSCLLYPNGPISELRDCVKRFEQALEHMQTAQQNMDLGIARIQQLDAQFPTH